MLANDGSIGRCEPLTVESFVSCARILPCPVVKAFNVSTTCHVCFNTKLECAVHGGQTTASEAHVDHDVRLLRLKGSVRKATDHHCCWTWSENTPEKARKFRDEWWSKMHAVLISMSRTTVREVCDVPRARCSKIQIAR